MNNTVTQLDNAPLDLVIYDNNNRTDAMTGVFSEYNYKWGETVNLTTGVRADYYNVTGLVYGNPRLNIKYTPSEQTAIRFSAGRAMRVSNFISDNISLLASNREIIIDDNLLPEIAWNYGANITHCFYLFDREGSINVDFYRTEFENQIVVDIEQQGILSFSNLNYESSSNQSFSNSLQFDINYELFNRFDMKLAYKINDVKTTYDGELKQFPLLAKNRALVNMSYSNKSDSWLFDATCNYIGESRIPEHSKLDRTYILETSNPFSLFNFQITKKINKFDFYIGGENLLNYTQDNPILGLADSDDFDASLIWAPVMGRLMYFGLRFKINN
jgi:outer membrane receptor protein involved in Fe transport